MVPSNKRDSWVKSPTVGSLIFRRWICHLGEAEVPGLVGSHHSGQETWRAGGNVREEDVKLMVRLLSCILEAQPKRKHDISKHSAYIIICIYIYMYMWKCVCVNVCVCIEYPVILPTNHFGCGCLGAGGHNQWKWTLHCWLDVSSPEGSTGLSRFWGFAHGSLHLFNVAAIRFTRWLGSRWRNKNNGFSWYNTDGINGIGPRRDMARADPASLVPWMAWNHPTNVK